MAVELVDFAYPLRAALGANYRHLSLGHIQQVLAAAVGYNSLAAFQTAAKAGQEPRDFLPVRHLVFDLERVDARLQALGLETTLTAEQVMDALARVCDSGVGGAVLRVCRDFDDLERPVYEDIEARLADDERVSAELVSINHDGVDDVDIEQTLDARLLPLGEHRVLVSGQITTIIPEERPFNGDRLDAVVAVTFTRLGQRCFSDIEWEVELANVDSDSWRDTV